MSEHQEKFLKDKILKEANFPTHYASHMKLTIQESKLIDFALKITNEFNQTYKDLQNIYDHLVADGYEQIDKIQSLINKKYVKFQESHEVKYKIQTKLKKKETEMMELVTKKFKSLGTNKSLKSQGTLKNIQQDDE